MQNLTAGWPAPARVRTLVTTRDVGVSLAPYASLIRLPSPKTEPACGPVCLPNHSG